MNVAHKEYIFFRNVWYQNNCWNTNFRTCNKNCACHGTFNWSMTLWNGHALFINHAIADIKTIKTDDESISSLRCKRWLDTDLTSNRAALQYGIWDSYFAQLQYMIATLLDFELKVSVECDEFWWIYTQLQDISLGVQLINFTTSFKFILQKIQWIDKKV